MNKAAIMGSLVILLASPVFTQEDVKRTTALEFRSSLFSAALPGASQPVGDGSPAVFLFAKVHGEGLGREASLQRENLIRFFNLPGLEAVSDASTARLAWESGTWAEYRTRLPRAVQTVRLGEEDYTVSLIPEEVDVDGRAFRFTLEIYRNAGAGAPGALKSAACIARREIQWDFGGPLAAGFYFPDRVYFKNHFMPCPRSL